jgi:DNA-binding CsgD family transcriptional regulator
VPPRVHIDGLGALAPAPAIQNGVAMFERVHELELVDAALERARSGRGTFVILDGPSGSGRSAILSLAGEHGAGAGMRVLTAGGHEPERDVAFGGALQLFHGEIARAGPGERARLLSGAARIAAPLLTGGAHEGLPEESPSAVLHGLYRLCCHLSERAPLLIAVDDGHAVDEATLHLLLYLTHRLADLPAVVLLAANVGAMPPDLGGLVRHPRATLIRLRPLGRDGTARWLRSAGFPEAESEFCAACHEATGGDRYLLRELAAELGAQGVPPSAGSIPRVEEAAPRSVAHAMHRRLARLSPGAVELAEAIVTLGSGAELRHAAELAGIEPAEAGVLTGRLVTAGVLRGSGRLAFVHPLVARALDAHRAPTERAEAHLAAARALRADGAPEARIAHHLMNAPGRGSEWVVDLLERQAATSLAGGAPEPAATYLQRALAEPPAPERRRALVSALARAEAMAGAPGALARLRRASELLEPGPERAVVQLWTGRTLMAQVRFRTAAGSFRAGLADTGEQDEPLRAQLAASYAVAARLGFSEPPGDVPEVEGGGPAGTLEARLALARAAFDEALAGSPAEEVRRLALQALGPGVLVEAEGVDGLGAMLAASALTLTGDLQAGEALFTATIELGRERGSASGLTIAYALRAMTILRRGRLGDALADVQAARSAHPDAWRESSYPAQAIATLVHLERGAAGPAAAQVTRWERSADPTAGLPYMAFLMTRGRLHRARGAPEEALADFLDCGRRAVALDINNPAVLQWRSQAALAAFQLGRRRDAAALAETELELARSFGAPDAIGQALHALGTIEGGAEGMRRYHEAVAVLDSSQAVLALARALIDHGAALRKSSRRQAAREPLRRGLDLARRCQADALVRRGFEELALAGARPRRSALSGADALTTRERQVARLAGEGRSNREISEVLVVTMKTVEWHLRHAYRKLGIESRRELASALEERDLSPP